jgi:hypothetical protein
VNSQQTAWEPRRHSANNGRAAASRIDGGQPRLTDAAAPSPLKRSSFIDGKGASALQQTVGNQAVLRMLGGNAAGDVGGPVLQRQDAGAAPATTPTGGQTQTTGPGQGAVPAGTLAWSSSMLDAAIEDSNNPQCLGTVRAGGGMQFSANCGNIRGPFCQPAGVAFRVDFTVDVLNAPRPSGFTPPTVSVELIFVNGSGAVTQNIKKQDSKPRYASPGVPLDPAFGHDFPFSTMESGWLHIHLQLMDPDSGATIDYNDRVTFTVTPCT